MRKNLSVPALLAPLFLLVALGQPLPAAANGPCGSPLDFSGTYVQSCAGEPRLVTHAAVEVNGRKKQVDHTFRLYCDRQDPAFETELVRLRQAVEQACIDLAGRNCAKLAQDVAAGVRALNDGTLGRLPRRLEVNVWWDQLPWIPFGANRHRAQLTDAFSDGNAWQANYVLDNTCDGRGKIGAVGLAVPHFGGNRHGVCFTSLAAATEGKIDPTTFSIRRDVTLDASLTCLGDGAAVNVGATFQVALAGRRQ